MPQTCPNCHLINLDTATYCDCGVNLSSKVVENARYEFTQKEPQSLRTGTAFAILMAVIILLGSAYFLALRDYAQTPPRHVSLLGSLLVAAIEVFWGLLWGSLVGLVMWASTAGRFQRPSRHIVLTTVIVTSLVAGFKLTRSLGQSWNTLPERHQQSVNKSRDTLSPFQQAQLAEIAKRVMYDPEYLTDEVREEFWRILGEQGGASMDTIKGFRETLVSMMVTFQTCFWEDALLAFRSKRPVKSQQCEQLELTLLEKKLIGQDRIEQNELLLRQIASGVPVTIREEQVVLSEDYIRNTLNNVQAAAKRLDRLFTPVLEKGQG